MTDIVNLNKFKKTKEKQEKKRKAHENRIVHGLSGAEKANACAEVKRAQVHLEKRRLEPGLEIKTVDEPE